MVIKRLLSASLFVCLFGQTAAAKEPVPPPAAATAASRSLSAQDAVLFMGVLERSTDRVTLALRHGADIEARMDGLTPLMKAAKIGAYDVAVTLLEHGANVYAQDSAMMEALDLAMSEDHRRIVAELLKYRAKTPGDDGPVRRLMPEAQEKGLGHLFDQYLATRPGGASFGVERQRKPRAETSPPLNPPAVNAALIQQIERVRTKFRGQSLWLKGRTLESDEGGAPFLVPMFSPVTVIDIKVHPYLNTGIWDARVQPAAVYVQAQNGRRGHLPLINSSEFSLLDFFEATFSTTDPKKAYGWSAKVWQFIDQRKVFIGMAAPQARMSWGEPDEVSRTTGSVGTLELWTYRDGEDENNYLYIEKGVVSAIRE